MYADALNADRQITMEEQIAAVIFDWKPSGEVSETECCPQDPYLTDEDCAEMGRRILLMVLQEFRPALVRE